MELSVLNIKGEDLGRKIELQDSVFAVEANDHAVYLDVKQFLANNRQGTHKAKERGEIAGSTKKIKKQKGTGTARFGSIKNPLFRGGGRVFGPKPRDYSFKLNKKLKKVARKSALTYKAKDSNIVVLEDFNFEAPKTKQAIEMLNNLKVQDIKTLIVVADNDANLVLSTRNLQKVQVRKASELNTYDILNCKKLILAESSVKAIEEVLS